MHRIGECFRCFPIQMNFSYPRFILLSVVYFHWARGANARGTTKERGKCARKLAYLPSLLVFPPRAPSFLTLSSLIGAARSPRGHILKLSGDVLQKIIAARFRSVISKVLVKLFQKLAGQGRSPCRTPQSAKHSQRAKRTKGLGAGKSGSHSK